MKKLSLLFVACLQVGMLLSQAIDDVRFWQEGEWVNISYTLSPGDSGDQFEVSLFCSLNGGEFYIPVSHAIGAVGPQEPAENKLIQWRFQEAIGNGSFPRVCFKVEAKVNRASPPPQKPKLSKGPKDYTSIYIGDMVFVEGGTFMMGSETGEDDEKPIHQVTLDSYYLGRHEVTQKQWLQIMGDNPSVHVCEACPVTNVSWEDVQAFLTKLNQRSSYTYRLPTEAEWEYAAGGGSSGRTTYSGTDEEAQLGQYAWNSANSDSKPQAVGGKQANHLGLHDMSGNVWEWCQDRYADYPSTAQTHPAGPKRGSYRVQRGGSWGSNPQYCRVADRGYYVPSNRNYYLGFRLCRTP